VLAGVGWPIDLAGVSFVSRVVRVPVVWDGARVGMLADVMHMAIVPVETVLWAARYEGTGRLYGLGRSETAWLMLGASWVVLDSKACNRRGRKKKQSG